MKKFIAGLSVFIILVVYPLTLLVTVVRYTILKPPVVKQVIRASHLGEEFPQLVADTIAERSSNEESGSVNTEQLVNTTLTPADVYGVTDQIVDVTATWLGTNQPIEEMDLRISTGPLKAKLLENVKGEVNLDFIPDELTMQDLLQQQDGVTTDQLHQWNKTVDQLRDGARSLFFGMWIGWGIIAFCLLLIILLRFKPVSGLFSWLGWTSLLMTMELIPLTIFIWLAPGWILPWISGAVDTTIVNMLNAALGEVMQHLIWPLCWVMGGTFLISITSFILRIVLKKR